MEFWPPIVENSTLNKPMDEFAVVIDNISKIVYSPTLNNVDWKNTELKNELVKEYILELKNRAGAGCLLKFDAQNKF